MARNRGKKDEDFAGYDEEQFVGWIFIETGGPTKGLWRWTAAYPKGFKGQPIVRNAGYIPTAAEAAKAVEGYWDATKARL